MRVLVPTFGGLRRNLGRDLGGRHRALGSPLPGGCRCWRWWRQGRQGGGCRRRGRPSQGEEAEEPQVGLAGRLPSRLGASPVPLMLAALGAGGPSRVCLHVPWAGPVAGHHAIREMAMATSPDGDAQQPDHRAGARGRAGRSPDGRGGGRRSRCRPARGPRRRRRRGPHFCCSDDAPRHPAVAAGSRGSGWGPSSGNEVALDLQSASGS